MEKTRILIHLGQLLDLRFLRSRLMLGIEKQRPDTGYMI